MNDKSNDLSLDQYYTSLRDFNQYSKPKVIESNIDEINKNIYKIQDKLAELSGDTIFSGNDEIDDLYSKLADAKNYLQFSLIPATEKIKELQKLLEQRNQKYKFNGHLIESVDLKGLVVANEESFDYNPKFTNYLSANSKGSLSRLKSIHLSKLDTDILSLIEEIKKMSYYDFENDDVVPAIQVLYGAYPVEYQPKYGVEYPVEYQPAYGVEPVLQPKYGVMYPIPTDVEIAQPMYGVEYPVEYQPAYGVEPALQPLYGVEYPVEYQPKYGVEYPIPTDIEIAQPMYGVEYPVEYQPAYGVEPALQPLYGVEAPPIISEHLSFTDSQPKYGVIAP